MVRFDGNLPCFFPPIIPALSSSVTSAAAAQLSAIMKSNIPEDEDVILNLTGVVRGLDGGAE